MYTENSLFSLVSNAKQIAPILLDGMSHAKSENQENHLSDLFETLKTVLKRTEGKKHKQKYRIKN